MMVSDRWFQFMDEIWGMGTFYSGEAVAVDVDIIGLDDSNLN